MINYVSKVQEKYPFCFPDFAVLTTVLFVRVFCLLTPVPCLSWFYVCLFKSFIYGRTKQYKGEERVYVLYRYIIKRINMFKLKW